MDPGDLELGGLLPFVELNQIHREAAVGRSRGSGGIEEGIADTCVWPEKLVRHTGDHQGQADEDEEQERRDQAKAYPVPQPNALLLLPAHGLPVLSLGQWKDSPAAAP